MCFNDFISSFTAFKCQNYSSNLVSLELGPELIKHVVSWRLRSFKRLLSIYSAICWRKALQTTKYSHSVCANTNINIYSMLENVIECEFLVVAGTAGCLTCFQYNTYSGVCKFSPLFGCWLILGGFYAPPKKKKWCTKIFISICMRTIYCCRNSKWIYPRTDAVG